MSTLKELLSEIDQGLADRFEEQLTAIVEDKAKAARKEGFEQGFEEAIKEAKKSEEASKAELDRVNEQHAEKLQEKIDEIDGDHTAKMQKVLEKIDVDHRDKLQAVIEKIDDDHTNKFERALELIDEDHTAKLQMVKEYYEMKYEDSLVEATDSFLETFLEEVAPEADTVDSIKLARLEEMCSTMREMLMVNDDYVQTEIREAIEDAESQLNEKQETINELLSKQIELKDKIKEHEAAQLLESKTKDMKPAEAAFVKKYLKGATAEEISEKLDEAIKAYEADEADERNELIKEAGDKTTEVVVPEDDTLEGDDDSPGVDENDNALMESYASRVVKSQHARK